MLLLLLLVSGCLGLTTCTSAQRSSGASLVARGLCPPALIRQGERLPFDAPCGTLSADFFPLQNPFWLSYDSPSQKVTFFPDSSVAPGVYQYFFRRSLTDGDVPCTVTVDLAVAAPVVSVGDVTVATETVSDLLTIVGDLV
jgi:hypothetical protein